MCDACRSMWNKFYWPTGMCVDAFLYIIFVITGLMCVRTKLKIVENIREKWNN